MRVLQISPTLLETYRQVTLGVWNLTAERLVEQLTGTYQINEASSRGWAYHQLIENGGQRYKKTSLDALKDSGMDYHEIKGMRFETWYEIEDWRVKKNPWSGDFDPVWRFTEKAALPGIIEHDQYAGLVHEVWVDWYTRSLGQDIRIRMKVDGLNGATIEEYKTSKMAGKYKRYHSSLQWQCYLEALQDANVVRYTHIQLGTNNDWARVNKYLFNRGDYEPRKLQEWIDGLVGWLLDRPDLCQRLVRDGDNSPLPF